MMNVLGLDIGGANLKAADPDGRACSMPFPLWQQPEQLTDALRQIAWPDRPNLVGVTMTGELADCFPSRPDGVRFLIDCVTQAFPHSETRFWMTSGEFAHAEDAGDFPELVAAANWHVLATWMGRAVPRGTGLLVDLGSTTCDIIPLRDGLPDSEGRTDLERLRSRELVYTGIGRTPLCAVLPAVELNGHTVPVAAELFATMRDVWLLAGMIPEDPSDTETADGRPATRQAAEQRIARMLCTDAAVLGTDTIRQLADQFAAAQRSRIGQAIRQVMGRMAERASEDRMIDPGQEEGPEALISGSGAAMAEQIVSACGLKIRLNLQQAASPDVATAACAFAAARLVQERCRDELPEQAR